MSSQNLTILNKPGSCLYYSCLFLTKQQKLNLQPLLSFIWRTERIPRFSSEQEVVITQLSWWQKEIALAYNHQATHPLVIELIQNIENLAEQNNQSEFAQKKINSLVSSLSYLISQQQDCQIDNAAGFLHHANKKRKEFIVLAAELIEAEPLEPLIISMLCELLVSIDIVDGFHRDAASGLISLPLDFLITEKITVDVLTNTAQINQQFWEQWLGRSLKLYNKLWLQKHPLIEVIIIYSVLRLMALKKSLQKASSTSYSCYNSRPTLSPLQKFWLSWRIRSSWNSGKKPLRILTP